MLGHPKSNQRIGRNIKFLVAEETEQNTPAADSLTEKSMTIADRGTKTRLLATNSCMEKGLN